MNNPDARRNLNESGYVLHGQEVESIYGPEFDDDLLADIKNSFDKDLIQRIENFDTLKPQQKILLLKEFTGLKLTEKLAYIDTRDERLLLEANRIVEYYVNLAEYENAPEMAEDIENGELYHSRLTKMSPRDINVGLTRDLLGLFMKNTVESEAHSLARGWLRKELDNKNLSNKDYIGHIPPVKGYNSGIRPDDYRGNSNEFLLGVWATLIEANESVDYYSHRELSKEELTYKLARVIKKSSEYDGKRPRPRSTFAESLAWAQLSPDAQQELKYRHIKHGVNYGDGLENFIGKSAPNMYRKAYYATQKSIEEIQTKLENDPENELLHTMLAMEIENHKIVKAKFESNMSPLDKAIALGDAYASQGLQNQALTSGDVERFWMNAKMGEISWAYNALRNNVNLDTIMKFTVLHRAVEFAGSRYGISHVDRDLLHLFGLKYNSFLSEYEFSQLAKYYKFAKEKFPEDKSVIEDLSKIMQIVGSYNDDEVIGLLKDRKAIAYLANNEWVLRSGREWRRVPSEIFPFDKDIRSQYKWLYDNSEAFIEGVDWDSQAKIILHRLRMGVDRNVHDATYWLKELSINPEIINKNIDLETELIESLFITNDQKELAKFPSNEKRLLELFTDKRRINFYLNLLRLKKENSSWGIAVDELKEYRDKFPGVVNPLRPIRKFNEVLKDLKEVADYRRDYSRDLLKWLSTHSDSPRDLLSSAWQSRDLALANGCPDNPRAIINWADLNKIRVAIEQGRLKIDKDVFENNEDFFREISRAVSVHDLEKAFKWYSKRSESQILSADVIRPKEGYKFEILSKDDPRGFTIGYDTGCCMTVGGISDSCIKAGYRHEDCGFLALYGPDGRIRAQSYWYINPKHPNVLVLDNIEANEGRDFDSIVELYRLSLKQYMSDHPELEIYQVNVGTGYTDVNLGGLKKTKTIRNIHGEYTDADNQRVLIEQEV